MIKTKIGIVAKAFLFWIIFESVWIWGGLVLPVLPTWGLGATSGAIFSSLMFALTLLFIRNETLTLSDLGMRVGEQSIRRFLLSFLVGMAFFGSFYLVYLGLTPVKVVSIVNFNAIDAIVLSFFVFLFLGTMEEIIFRGYFLKKLETGIGIRAAIYITSIAFGFYHGLSLDSLTGPAIWGLWYAVLAYWSKGLAIPIGFHAGANYIQALFGEKQKWVSGVWGFDLTEESTLFSIEQISMFLRVVLLIGGMVLVEFYIRKSRQATKNETAN